MMCKIYKYRSSNTLSFLALLPRNYNIKNNNYYHHPIMRSLKMYDF